MACCLGGNHTACIDNDGVLRTFGCNINGQLGLDNHYNYNTEPTIVKNLPKIAQVSCGQHFTACVDEEGFVWVFGDNKNGQLGCGEGTRKPKQIQDIPPVQFVSCGNEHTLIITKDSNLWSIGKNDFGQLALGYANEKEIKPQKTLFSDILKICAGNDFSLFQDFNKNLYGCGTNIGFLGSNNPQIEVSLILNQPLNIQNFCCTRDGVIFLDFDGKVFYAGNNQIDVIELLHVPAIKAISCAGDSKFLLDFNGFVWSFGINDFGQLAFGDSETRYKPTRVQSFFLKNIEQFAIGCSSGKSMIFRDSKNIVFGVGSNFNKIFGTDKFISTSIPIELKSINSIWGDEILSTYAKSARK